MQGNNSADSSIHMIIGAIIVLLVGFLLFVGLVVKTAEYSAKRYQYNVIINGVNVLHVASGFIVLIYLNNDTYGLGMGRDVLWWPFGITVVAFIINAYKTNPIFGAWVTLIQPFGLALSFLLYKWVSNLVAIAREDSAPR